jgi:poly-gamma-glutamate capsule biosynthesis protein CapA/YwtB (metallophosphatase superfamily)
MLMWRVVCVICVCAAVLVVGCAPARRPHDAPAKVTLAAVGDVLLCRGVGKQIDKHGADWLFDDTRDVLKGADLAFCNLECPLSKRGVAQKRRFLFRADPELAKALHSNGLDVVSLANNHTLDYGRDAMLDTIEAVRGAGMIPVGAGRNKAQASQLRVVTSTACAWAFWRIVTCPATAW